MNDLPSTIRHPDTFMRSAPPGFDGAMDWSWMFEVFPNPRDTPQDVDFFKERRGQILIGECKAPGVRVPKGQLVGLNALHLRGSVTIYLVWGKTAPEYGQIWWPRDFLHRFERRSFFYDGRAGAVRLLQRWWDFADARRPPRGLWDAV